ncbi:2064_t:CDS:2 [Paraglomus brasilianum]|uniref:2064_t:CDS:1 n=1 Tax=Paraglomus brasilianum TaxID=144538 RepID=A0A9N8ZU12_9GLOM|nr:2064_t:CDS:2 [Paraglomus brasilianum]
MLHKIRQSKETAPLDSSSSTSTSEISPPNSDPLLADPDSTQDLRLPISRSLLTPLFGGRRPFARTFVFPCRCMVEEEIHFYENPDEFDLPAVAVVGKGDGFVWNEELLLKYQQCYHSHYSSVTPEPGDTRYNTTPHLHRHRAYIHGGQVNTDEVPSYDILFGPNYPLPDILPS